VVIINAMHLGGVQSPYRYLMYFIPWSLLFFDMILMVEVLYDTSSHARKMLIKDDGKLQKRFSTMKIALGFFLTGSFLVVDTAIPIVFYFDKWELNWCYAFFMFVQGFCGTVTVCALGYFNNSLLKQVRSALTGESEKSLGPVIKKVRVLSPPPPTTTTTRTT